MQPAALGPLALQQAVELVVEHHVARSAVRGVDQRERPGDPGRGDGAVGEPGDEGVREPDLQAGALGADPAADLHGQPEHAVAAAQAQARHRQAQVERARPARLELGLRGRPGEPPGPGHRLLVGPPDLAAADQPRTDAQPDLDLAQGLATAVDQPAGDLEGLVRPLRCPGGQRADLDADRSFR